MKKADIEKAFSILASELEASGIKGEIGVVGGAAMVLAFDARAATKDVDAIFKPTIEIRTAAEKVAKKLKLPKDWLNDAVKGFLPGHPLSKNTVFDEPSLRVWVPPAEYLLAMKSISARLDTNDGADIRTLCQKIGVTSIDDVIAIIENYYPKKQVPPKTVFFLEEILSES